jgi:uncharacterized Fe-S cluster protein YjdI
MPIKNIGGKKMSIKITIETIDQKSSVEVESDVLDIEEMCEKFGDCLKGNGYDFKENWGIFYINPDLIKYEEEPTAIAVARSDKRKKKE